jgi:hypothetical protein
MLKKEYVSRWNLSLQSITLTPKEMYDFVEKKLKEEEIPDIKTSRVNLSEKGFFSNKREYLRIEGKGHFFYVCVAPFGRGFFMSYWLLENRSSKKSFLNRIPFIGGFLEQGLMPETFYTVDTRGMFLGAIHNCIVSSLNKTLDSKGYRKLTEIESQLPPMN